MTTTTTKGIAVPEEDDPPLVPQDIGAVAEWLDTNPGIAALSQTEINALAGIDLWIGRVVWNETTSQHQGYNGVTWVPIGAGVQSFTAAEIAALPGAQKSLGMIVWNTTVGYHQAWNGASWEFVNDMPRVTTVQRDALTPFVGMMVWNTTTVRHEWWDGTAWRLLNPGSAGAYGVVGVASDSATNRNIAVGGAWTDIPGCSITLTTLAGRRYIFHGEMLGFFNGAGASNAQIQILRDGATLVALGNVSVAAAVQAFNIVADGSEVPPAGLHTYKLQVRSNSGGVQVDNLTGKPAFLRIQDAGEDAQVTTPTTIVPPDLWNGSWGEPVAPIYAKIAAPLNIAAETAVPLLSGSTFTAQAGRRYRINLLATFSSSVNPGIAAFFIKDGAAILQRVVGYSNLSGYTTPASGVWEGTFTPGVHTINVTITGVSPGGGTVSMDGNDYSSLSITDVGPVNPLAPTSWPPRPNPGPWTALPFTAGWSSYGVGYSTGAYRIVGDRVELRGVVKNAAPAAVAGQVIATLPAAARPPANLALAAGASGGMCQFEIRISGDLAAAAGLVGAPTTAYVWLDGITYSLTA